MVVYTIGHSTRELSEFVGLLDANGVHTLVDVRTIPRSRRVPQFNGDTLPASLGAAGIAYVHAKALGGLRHPRASSTNSGWRNDSFRGFADYMQTPEFETALDDLVGLAGSTQIAIMCAEAVYWRCHRSLIADALVARGIPVEHIMGRPRREPHRLTSFAVLDGIRVSYPAQP